MHLVLFSGNNYIKNCEITVLAERIPATQEVLSSQILTPVLESIHIQELL